MPSPPRRLAETMPEDPKDPKAMIGFAGMLQRRQIEWVKEMDNDEPIPTIFDE